MKYAGNEDDGFEEDFDDAEARSELTHKMRTEGALIAYRTAISICLDPKASAAAKASAVNSLFRVGGFFANQESGDRTKDLSEMSSAEVSAALRKTQAALKSLEDEAKKPKGSLFD